MENDKQKMRQEAAKAFMASLDDFQNMLAETEEKPAPVVKPPSKKKDVDIFEEALADIDAFMEKRSPPES